MTTMTIAQPAPSRARSLLFAFIGIPVLALLGFFWLEIPDSHIWQLAFSLVTGALIAIAFLWLVSSVVRSLRNTLTACVYWLGAILTFLWLLVSYFLIKLASQIDDNAMQRAGYWNSKLSASMRVTFTFDRLIAWQHDLVLILVWIVIPALVLPFLIETVSCGISGSVWGVAARTLRRWQHWLAIIFCDVVMYWLTDKLTGWRPSHSVHGELISLALRLALCYIADLFLIALLLAVDSRLLAHEHARRHPAAEPTANAA